MSARSCGTASASASTRNCHLSPCFEQPRQSDFGEIALPAAFQLAKQLRQAPKKIAAEIQARVFEQVTYIPLGHYVAPSVWRKSLSGVVDGPATPVFWNIDKSE